MCILLIEDNPGDARLISEMLKETEQSFSQFHWARSLKNAIEYPLDHATVATVLLDLGLPDSEGIDTLIATREAYPNSSIVVLTGVDNEEMTLRALREGAQSYLTKSELIAATLDITIRYSLERHQFILRLRAEEQRNRELIISEELARTALESEQHLSAMKSKFVSLISHEFRTPLAIIQIAADLIDRHASGLDPEKVRLYSSRIQTKVGELTAMLRDLLELEKLEQHTLHCKPSEFDVVQLIDDLIKELQPLAKKDQRLIHEHQGDRGMVLLDQSMLSSILNNLIGNAIKYSAAGAIIKVNSELDMAAVTVSVHDDGIGIPLKDQASLFQRFFRGSNVDHSHGTGLGLPIVKRYLELMGGNITFKSDPGHTVFTVALPRYMAQEVAEI